MNKLKYYISIILLLFIFSGCDDEPGLKEEDLTAFNKITWLKGIWEGKQGDANLYESWRSKNYRTLEGLSYTSVGGERVYVQTMRIEQNNNRIILAIKSSDENEETILELKEANNQEIVFENTSGTFPEQVIYKKDEKNRMTVEVSGDLGGEDRTQQFNYKKTEQT